MSVKDLRTQTEWFSVVSAKEARRPYVRKALDAEAEAPPAPTRSASGPQLLRSYQPTQNELDFIQSLRDATGELSAEMVDLIECAQFRKVTGGPIQVSATPAQRKFIKRQMKQFEVDPMFV